MFYYLFTTFGVLYFTLWVWVTNRHPAWRASFSISYSSGLLLLPQILLIWKGLYFVVNLKDIFGGYRNFDWHVIFLFQHLNSFILFSVCISCCFFPNEKSHSIYIIDLLCNVSSLDAFRFSFYSWFSAV